LKKLTASLTARSKGVEIVHIHAMAVDAFRSYRVFDSFLDDLNPNLFTFFVKK